ncbi:MAG: SRPBCC family protein [Pseudolysinimonas sp.]
MSQIIETIDVAVPVSTAYNQWTQFEQFPEFLEHVESITQTDATHTMWKVNIGGQVREFAAEITEQHPDERVAWNSTGGEVDHAGVVTFHKLDHALTRVTVQIDWQPDGLLEKIGSATGVASHVVKEELEHFKEYIEKKGSADGAWRGDVKAS